MTLQYPEYLILLPVLLFVAIQWKSLHLEYPLRALLVLLITITLSHPVISNSSGNLDLWVLVDRSASAVESLTPRLREWETILTQSKERNDRIHFIDFADEAQLRTEGDIERFAKNPHHTRIALATRYALSRMDQSQANRLLLLSDGYSTEPLLDLGERLLRARTALDYRLIREEGVIDFRISELTMPLRVAQGESFLIELQILGTADQPVKYQISRDGTILQNGNVTLSRGRAVLRFTDRLDHSGAYSYQAQIRQSQDTHLGNNTMQSWLEVSGTPEVLLLTSATGDPWIKALQEMKARVQVVRPGSPLHLGSLTGKRAVILSNVGAYALPREFLDGLEFYVQAQGGGLLMTGGKQSFGSGGYFGSSVDQLLPVSMELREEHRKQAISMAVVLDRSGSMAVGVGGNMGDMTKMDLANEGAARTASLLGKGDRIAILAVDSEAHVVVPLTPISGNEQMISSQARSVTSGGGGIYVYNGLRAAWDLLKSAPTKQRHIILFADAADAEQPDDYRNLLVEIRNNGGSVSVIGLGTERDVDADFLKDVAIGGEGRMFFVSNAMDLPAVFTQETASIARSAFIEEPTNAISTPSWAELTSSGFSFPQVVDGYNLNYLKPEASTAILTVDEYQAPLVAFWQRGVGRVAAISCPVSGDFSERIRSWPGYADFLQTVSRWLFGPELPAGIALKTRLEGSTLMTDFYYETNWEKEVAFALPILSLVETTENATLNPVWERVEPGHLQSALNLKTGQAVRGALRLGDRALPFGPVGLGQDAEWAFDRSRVLELEQLAKLSGGEERVDLEKIWEVPRPAQITSLRIPLLIVILSLFLLEALLTRLNHNVQVQWKALDLSQWKLTLPSFPLKQTRTQPKSNPQPPTPEPPSSPSPPPAPTAEDALRNRLERAKRRGLR